MFHDYIKTYILILINNFYKTLKQCIIPNIYIIFIVSIAITYQCCLIGTIFNMHKQLISIIPVLLIIEIIPIFISITLGIHLGFLTTIHMKIMHITQIFKNIHIFGINIRILCFYMFILKNIFLILIINFIGILIGLCGIYCTIKIYCNLSMYDYIVNIMYTITYKHVLFNINKMFIFSLLISLISIYFGLNKNITIFTNYTIFIFMLIFIINGFINIIIFYY